MRLLLLLALLTSDPSADDWYPKDITPPAGTQYPCALTALPRDLPGVPPAERTFVNHTYTLVLRATQAKLRVLKELEAPAAHARYSGEIDDLLRKLRAEPVPPGLEPFRDDVAAALELQQAFFAEVARRYAARGTTDGMWEVPQGRQASQRLLAAWSKMERRYPSWTPEMRDSVYHHLCALDLF